jgi:ribosomal protein S18 acetylase RimI-like enzyme
MIVPQTVKIRDWEETDLPAIAEMASALRVEQGGRPISVDTARLWEEVSRGVGGLRGFVCEMVDEIVGYILTQYMYDPIIGLRGVHMCDIYVSRSHRRKGIGKRLFLRAAEAAREDNRMFMWWVSKKRDQVASQFYDAIGASLLPANAHVIYLTYTNPQ